MNPAQHPARVRESQANQRIADAPVPAKSNTVSLRYFDRPWPRALIFGSFIAVTIPLLAMRLWGGESKLLSQLMVAHAVGLGTTHFFVTLAVYLRASNLRHFSSSWAERVRYFGLPALILGAVALVEALPLRSVAPTLATTFYFAVRFADFFHVGRQHVGMLQIWKRGAQLPGWTRSAENAFFVGLALMQWQTHFLGGRFAAGQSYAVLPACALGLLALAIAAQYVKALAQPGTRAAARIALTYFAIQALGAAAAVYDTALYLISLSVHYVEYHVIMAPRNLAPDSPPGAAEPSPRGLWTRPLFLYGALAAVVLLFEARNHAPAEQVSTRLLVHAFDGIFLLHYVLDAFLWKFRKPYFRQQLGPLYFGPESESASAPAVPSTLGWQPPSAARVGLYCAFFCSGVAALAFETLWFRQASLAFGNTVWASSIVLGGFMGGMAAGYALGGRVAARTGRPLAWFVALELTVAVSGSALVLALPALPTFLAQLSAQLESAPLGLAAVRLVSAFLLLLLPAAAMGMTLPLLVASLRGKATHFARTLGNLYGWNTLGAVVGSCAVELWWMRALGVRGSVLAAAGCNVLAMPLAAGSASLLQRASAARTDPVTAPDGSQPLAANPRAVPPLLLASFGSGFAMLALEVIWLRFLTLFANDTDLAFTAVLGCVLFGVALGAFLAGAWPGGTARLAQLCAPIAAGCAALLVLGYRAEVNMIAREFRYDQDTVSLALFLVLPGSIASGMLFTALGAALRAAGGDGAGAAARISLWNTLGGVLGALTAGFVVLPAFGIERSVFAAAVLYALLALVLTFALGQPRRADLIAAVSGVLLLAAFPFGSLGPLFRGASVGRWMRPGDRVVAVAESGSATYSYVVHTKNGQPLFDQLATNAYSMSVNDFAARRYMDQYAYLPRAVHPGIKRALLIGYGIGNTLQAILDNPALERVDVVDAAREPLELSRRMLTLRRSSPLDDPRVHVHIEDGRHYLDGREERYDLITGEPPPPIIAGVVNLYTREFFERMHERLAPGGMATYWLPLMNLSAPSAQAIIAAFCGAFEDCSLWHGSARNFMLLGTRDAQGPVSREHFQAQWQDAKVLPELIAVGFERPEQLGTAFIGDATYLRELTKDMPPLTDDRPKRVNINMQRDLRDALIWRWRDTKAARARFAQSPLIARLWPESVRRDTLRQFENQRLLNDLLFPEPTKARQVMVLHQVLNGTPLRLPALLLLNSDPDAQRVLAQLPEAERDKPEWLLDRVAGHLAERDFRAARPLVLQIPKDKLPLPELDVYVEEGASQPPRMR